MINKIEFSAKNLTSNAGLFLLLEHANKNLFGVDSGYNHLGIVKPIVKSYHIICKDCLIDLLQLKRAVEEDRASACKVGG